MNTCIHGLSASSIHRLLKKINDTKKTKVAKVLKFASNDREYQ